MGIGDNSESTILKMLSAGSMPLIIKNIAYDANNNAEYVGIAMQGAANDAAAWRIEKLTWESDGVGGYRVTSSRFSMANVIWNARDCFGVHLMKTVLNPFTGELDLAGDGGGGGVSGTVWTHGIVIDGGGAPITTGSKGYFRVPLRLHDHRVDRFSDQTGSIVVDVKKGTYAGFPTTASIAGTEKPTLAAAQKNQDTGLTTWTPGLAADDVLEYVVDSAATVQRATVLLHVQRT